jgi:hypothetical protein
MNYRILIPIIGLVVVFSACEKDVPPKLSFRTGEGYTSSYIQAVPGSTFLVGCIAEKTKDDLSTFYVEYAFEPANVGFLADRWTLSRTEARRYERNYWITVRNQPGRERWIFKINDSEGRITQKEILITVQ